jgi:cytochrome o ubiquinol oxidase subunit 2
VASAGRLVIPAGRPVEFRITSSGVMNSFFVPQLGSQIYAMAGMVTKVNLEADHPGSYAGLSAQFSGDGFADMRFSADAMPEAQFEQWVEQVKQESPAPLDAAAYDALAEPGVLAKPVSFGALAPDMFQHALGAAVRGEMGHPAHPPLNKETD